MASAAAGWAMQRHAVTTAARIIWYPAGWALLHAGGAQILHVYELLRRRQRRLDRARLPHHGDHLREPLEIDLAAPGQDAALGLEKQIERALGDGLRRVRALHHRARHAAAVGGVANERERGGQRAHVADDRLLVRLRPRPPHGRDSVEQVGDRLRRGAEQTIALL